MKAPKNVSEDGALSTNELAALLAAREAECRWLATHYDQKLRDALAKVAALEAELAARPRQDAPAPAPDPVTPVEVALLKGEVDRLKAAEQRYIDRIEELKDRLERK